MSYSTIRAAIKTALEAVAGISGGAGKVVDHEPEVVTPESYVTNFANTAGTAINGWTITRTRVVENQQDPGFRFQRVHDILVRGRFGLQESSGSEAAFQDLVEAVMLAIRGSVSVWAEHPEDSEQAIQSEAVGHEMHGPFLVHLVEMRFSVEEFEVVTA